MLAQAGLLGHLPSRATATWAPLRSRGASPRRLPESQLRCVWPPRHSQLDHLTGNAMAVLGSLGEQRSSLKGVQRKVLDIASTLGVSNSVIRAIESRQFWDKMLVYGGMLLTLALLWLVFVRMRRDVPLDE